MILLFYDHKFLLNSTVLSVAKADLFASNNSEPGLEYCPKPCECRDLKTPPFGINVSCSGVELKNVSAWKLPASTTILYVYFGDSCIVFSDRILQKLIVNKR